MSSDTSKRTAKALKKLIEEEHGVSPKYTLCLALVEQLGSKAREAGHVRKEHVAAFIYDDDTARAKLELSVEKKLLAPLPDHEDALDPGRYPPPRLLRGGPLHPGARRHSSDDGRDRWVG